MLRIWLNGVTNKAIGFSKALFSLPYPPPTKHRKSWGGCVFIKNGRNTERRADTAPSDSMRIRPYDRFKPFFPLFTPRLPRRFRCPPFSSVDGWARSTASALCPYSAQGEPTRETSTGRALLQTRPSDVRQSNVPNIRSHDRRKSQPRKSRPSAKRTGDEDRRGGRTSIRNFEPEYRTRTPNQNIEPEYRIRTPNSVRTSETAHPFQPAGYLNTEKQKKQRTAQFYIPFGEKVR